MRRFLAMIFSLTFFLAACDDGTPDLRIGAKNFSESRILAEMILALAEEQGVPTSGIVDYPTTPAIMAAIKEGSVDIYPEYNGTGLVMLGQNPISNGSEATARVKELYGPLGLTWLDGFGFANNYGIAMRADLAAERGLKSISDLVPSAGSLAIAVEDDFTVRPLDGLEPLTQRYGMNFGNVDIVPLDDRELVYDKLLNGDVDIAEVYTTDGQISEYGLVLLEDDLNFFPIYDALPFARAEVLSRYPQLGPAISVLAGKITPDLMQSLNGRVDLEGRSPRAVARDALARMDLIDAGAVQTQDPLVIATEANFADSPQGALVLRAVQKAFTGRDAQYQDDDNPLATVGAGDARLALVGAEAFYDLSSPAPKRSSGYEAVAAVGQSVVHLIGQRDAVSSLAEIKTIAVGGEGSSSSRIAELVIGGLGMTAQAVPVEGGTAEVLAAVTNGTADAALVMTVDGDPAVAEAMADRSKRLFSLDGWSDGANLVRYPFLREARIAANTYTGQLTPVETLRTQLVLAGPAPEKGDVVGDQGPAAVAVELKPITASAVKLLNASIPGNLAVDPALPLAASLAPELPQPPAALNPSPGTSILSLVLVVFFIWLGWLLVRPEYR
ncbi:glycine betaine ABC transporter substrate-binding protein [Sedimentitalea todarodis]|uniref:Glycine betaine ABC transporter substrate-binding protein n=1 Tax=Sedimentitalea todarodis TaxID=1631240 RepID=A0ABU3VHB7_9RHOB|nr:glycine betaine ABC transporter substrate-binding protein [Sedimentitalea todarodis]MDU9005586.1 glycine betaine ABC transporter substrate-binding protein [Sedimentitalea todarodis]